MISRTNEGPSGLVQTDFEVSVTDQRFRYDPCHFFHGSVKAAPENQMLLLLVLGKQRALLEGMSFS